MDTLKFQLSLAILLIVFVKDNESLIAYDCGAPPVNLTTLSLLNVKDCNIPIVKPTVINSKIQLLQTTDFKEIHVFQCKIKIQRTIFYCGMHSHISVVPNSYVEYVEEVSYDKCKQLHELHAYETYNSIFNKIESNQTTNRPITFAGKVDNFGTCTGSFYSDHYGTWDNVISQGQIYFTIQDYTATVNLETDEIILRSGVRCIYSKGKCMDVEGGNTYWETVPTDYCNFNRYTVIYEGMADKISDHSTNLYNDKFYSVTSNDMTFALAVAGQKSVCNYELIRTEHPRLFIIDSNTSQFFKQQSTLKTTDLDLFTYINAKFVYLERHMRKQIINLYNSVITQECELEKKILRNSLALAAVSPADFAFHYMKEAGYMAHVAGEIVRIAKCVTVDVTRRETNRCYQELPVFRGEQELFMTPRTHILVKTGNEIECTSFLAPMYNINNAWFQFVPQLTIGIAPQEIATKTNISWEYNPPENLAVNGIYTTKDLEKLRKNMMFALEKPAVLNTIARGASGIETLNQGITINNLLDENAIRSKMEIAWGKFNTFLYTIGSFGVTAFGGLIFFQIIKYVIDVIVHGIALHKMYGWSAHLLGAIFSSLTTFLMYLGRKENRKNNKSTAKDIDLEMGIKSDCIEENKGLIGKKDEESVTKKTIENLYPNIEKTQEYFTLDPRWKDLK